MEQTYHDELDMDLCDGCGLEFCECDELWRADELPEPEEDSDND